VSPPGSHLYTYVSRTDRSITVKAFLETGIYMCSYEDVSFHRTRFQEFGACYPISRSSCLFFSSACFSSSEGPGEGGTG
jgi:hypothetical protein